MLLSDKPIYKRENDLLNRADFASQLAQSLSNHSDEDSLVIGFYGKWGSGKTSTINMMLEKLEESVQNDVQEKYIIIKFNPWNYSGQHQLISRFFEEVSYNISDNDGGNLEDLGHKLHLMSKIISPAKYIPGISQFGELAEKLLTSAAETFNAVNQDQSLEDIKSEINKELVKNEIRLVIIIDDIDRLQPNEMSEIFQLVKTVGDLNNSIYLLSFDKDVVANSLSKSLDRNGYEYLEKIIQIPFEMPVIDKQDVETILFNDLDRILEGVQGFDRTYWTNAYLDGLKPLIKNLRDTKRFTNLFGMKYNVIGTEVNPVDLIIISVIEVFLPELYKIIKDNPDLFVGATDRSDLGNTKEQQSERYKKIIEQVNEHLPFDISRLLNRIFPKTESFVRNMHYGHTWLSDWRQKKRICSPDYFETYFKLSLPKGEISESDMSDILESTSNVEGFSIQFQKLKDEGKLKRFLERIEDYSLKIAKENVKNIIMVLLNRGDSIQKVSKGLFSYEMTPYLIYRLIDKFPEQEEKYNLLYEVIEKANNSIDTTVQFLFLLEKDISKEDDPNLPDEKMKISHAQLIQLQELACKKIYSWLDENEFVETKNLPFVLYRWKEWNSEPSEINKYISNRTKDDIQLLSFVIGVMHEVKSQSGDNYTIETTQDLNPEVISDFMDIEVVYERLEKIKEEADDLTEKQGVLLQTAIDKIQVYLSRQEKRLGKP
ncbi:KAP family P-loop NTPase fold protein [Pseudalkalibacillus sp. R45]|uniref:KAP family P-loop NTPase fold protein n=1 Tax=Pseudalkalibacillus sp. R45 TaxID=3457433 RepID=UPI003FCD0FE3